MITFHSLWRGLANSNRRVLIAAASILFLFGIALTPHARGIVGPFVQERVVNANGGLSLNTDYDELGGGVHFQNEFYVGTGNDNGEAHVLMCTSTTANDPLLCDANADWSTVFTPQSGYETASSMEQYYGRLYVGTGSGSGNGDIFFCNPAITGDVNTCDPSDFSLAYNDSTARSVTDFTVFNDQLYAALTFGSQSALLVCTPSNGGRIDECDAQADWETIRTFPQADTITSLNPHYQESGKLYVGLSRANTPGAGDAYACNPAVSGDILRCDALDWSLAFDGAEESVTAISSFNGALYVGQGSSTGDADIFMCTAETCTPDDWQEVSGMPMYETVSSFGVFNSELYAGMGSSFGDGDVYQCNPRIAKDVRYCDDALDWSLAFQGSTTEVNALATYNNALYTLFGSGEGQGDAWYLLP